MRKSARDLENAIYAIASQKWGFFTAAEAKAAGYPDSVHPYHVKVGNWIRYGRGIYRLARFPTPDRPEVLVALLWTRDRHGVTRGVLSHTTALELRGLLPPTRDLIHVTVPRRFRRNSRPPAGVVLHRRDLSEADIEPMGPLRVTSVVRTLADLEETGYLESVSDLLAGPLSLGKPVPPLPVRVVEEEATPVARESRRDEDSWGGARNW